MLKTWKTTTMFSLIILMIMSGCIEELSPADDTSTNHIILEGKGEYTSIQKAIDASSDGDVIILSPGEYYETLLINQSISIVGAGAGKTIVALDETNTSSGSIISLVADNCTIKNITVTGYLNISRTTPRITGIELLSSNNKIIDNTIKNVSYGIYVKNYAGNNHISGNEVILNDNYGMYLSHASNNNITMNNISCNKQYGMYVASLSNQNMISGNIVSSNRIGIRLKGVQHNEVYGNKIGFNRVKGVYICCGTINNYIYKNSFIGNGLHADDPYNNQWSKQGYGNYWDDYSEQYPGAVHTENVWNTPYEISGGTSKDNYPLVKPIDTE